MFRTPFVLQWLYPSLEWQGKKDKIYLTFDDGPIPEVTEFVLQTLDEYEVKATFFCIGDNIRKHPGLFRKLVAAGHGVGNHTMHHLRGCETGDQEYIRDMERCSQQMLETAGEAGKGLFRPPYGRIKRSQIKKLPPGTRTIMWTALSQDYRQDLSPEQCLQGTLKAIRPGSIVLFHDSLKAEKNMRYALPGVLEFARERKMEFGLL